MYVEIFAKTVEAPDRDSTNESPGKLTWVNDSDPTYSLEFTQPKHLLKPPWHVEIKGKYTDENTGERGGDIRVMERSLEIQLTPADLTALFNFAIKKGLITVVEGTPVAGRSKKGG